MGYASEMAAPRAATLQSAARTGVRLELVTVVWMVAEATLAIGAGVVARSVLLTAFGADSVIELLSGGLLLWRLEAERRGGDLERVERTEVTAARLSASLLVALCLYVVATTAAGVFAHVEPDRSFLGLGVAAAALVVMPALAQGKRGVNRVLESAALRADIAETTVCAGMAATVLLGVALHATLGWWWAEYAAAVGLLVWLVVETKEVLEAARAGRARCRDDD
jgi:divalent metal cation (Fe/Co/Zn/Cd) transporter